MEYAAMLSAPDLVSGLRDLLADKDPAVVKRTVRVFANVYRHALGLLATGELDEETFRGAWPAVRSVAEELTGMLGSSENEGITFHVVRFLEAALVAHLLSDVSRFPDIAAQSPTVVNAGIEALRGLITTPYVGGSAFIVAVRALITVACYKRDLWEPVTGLIEAQISSPPPTLFDHNVRTFHKMLQRNLFRLLRRTESVELRGRLIDMMVTVGVPRRMLSHWAPPPETRHKRPASHSTPPLGSPEQEDNDPVGRTTPPAKRPRINDPDVTSADNDDDDNGRTPAGGRDPRESRDPREKRDPRESKREGRDPRPSRDPREVRPSRDPRAAKASASTSAPRDPRDPRLAESRVTPPLEKPTLSPTPETGRLSVTPPAAADASASLEFLKNLISGGRKSPATPADRSPSAKEQAVYERLDLPRVVALVLSCLEAVPDSAPGDLLQNLRGLSDNVEGMRRHLSTLLAPHMPDSIMDPPTSTSAPSRSPLYSREPSPPSPPSSDRSTPSDASIGASSASDVDLRHLLNRGFSASSSDVDMRGHHDPRRTSRDPRSAPEDPRRRHAPPSVRDAAEQDAVNVPRSSILDPRIAAGMPPLPNNNGFGFRQDPRMMGVPGGRPVNGPIGLAGGPFDPRVNRGPGLFGPGPGSNLRGPWQNGNQPNPLALMMNSINTAMFPQGPPRRRGEMGLMATGME